MNFSADQSKNVAAEKEEIYIRLFDIVTMENLRLTNELDRLKNTSVTEKKLTLITNLRGLRRLCYAYAYYGSKGFVKAVLRKLHLYKG